MTSQRLAGGFRSLPHRQLPVHPDSGQLDLTEDQIDHAVEELILVCHVVVERHCFDAKRLAQPPHAERSDPVLVHEGNAGEQHSFTCERGPCLDGSGAPRHLWEFLSGV